jgi:rod shape-determining protein MreC
MENLMGRYRNVSILAAAIFLQIVGLAVQVKVKSENESSRLIRVWAVTAVTPLEKGIVRLQAGGHGIWRNYLYLRGVRQDNQALQQQIQQLQLDQVRLKQDAEQAQRLQALLGFKEQFISQTAAAQVIGSSGSEQSRIVYLDKGSNQGIATDMAVISADGVVGKIIRVFANSSQVLLINDQSSGVGALLEQSRLQGILKGKASGELILDKIMSDEEVKPGEKVLTSGGDQIFPKGLPIGTVARVATGSQFLQVTLQPSAALNHLEEVLVITQKQDREPVTASGSTAARAADILAQRLPSVPDKPETPAPGSASASSQGTGPSPAQRPSLTQTQNADTSTAKNPLPGAAPAAKSPTAPAQDPKTAKPVAVKPAVVPVSKPATNTIEQPSPSQSQPPSPAPGDTPQ